MECKTKLIILKGRKSYKLNVNTNTTLIITLWTIRLKYIWFCVSYFISCRCPNNCTSQCQIIKQRNELSLLTCIENHLFGVVTLSKAINIYFCLMLSKAIDFDFLMLLYNCFSEKFLIFISETLWASKGYIYKSVLFLS